jgi:hypothetical protein
MADVAVIATCLNIAIRAATVGKGLHMLQLRDGDVVQELAMFSNGRWDGNNKGVRGYFPCNYCRIISKKAFVRETCSYLNDDTLEENLKRGARALRTSALRVKDTTSHWKLRAGRDHRHYRFAAGEGAPRLPDIPETEFPHTEYIKS